MPDQPLKVPGMDASSQLRGDYEAQQALLQAQPAIVQRFLQLQAQQIAEVLMQRLSQARFKLPDRVVDRSGKIETLELPNEVRDQTVGDLVGRLTGTDIRHTLHQRLTELEQSTDRAVALGAALIRHATALYLVYDMLPSGRRVRYQAADGEEIPTIPVEEYEPASAIMAATDAIVEEGVEEEGRGELLVPYVPAARRFYLPQWVAFDEQDRLLVNSIGEAEAHLASMERFVDVLHAAVSLAPYMVADAVYQEKRYGMLGQLVNQGRALARYQTRQMIRTIKSRASAGTLNRGLSLSLPYFDDQDLIMKLRHFVVIPAGRIMFVPAFVVRASREEQAKVAQDTRLSPSTRKHLLEELRMLEEAFFTP